MFDYSKAHKSKRLSDLSLSLENFNMATPVRNRPIIDCKPLSIEYFMYVYGLFLLFDFATKNLHLATIFYHLVDKCDLRILLISSPAMSPARARTWTARSRDECTNHEATTPPQNILNQG